MTTTTTTAPTTTSTTTTTPPTTTTTTTTAPTTTTTATPVCKHGIDAIDAITKIGEDVVVVFIGDQHLIVESGGVLRGEYPNTDFPLLEKGGVDAAISIDENLYIFQGSKVYLYTTNKELQNGFPKAINEVFPGIPNNLDAIFRWNRNGKLYMVKGNYNYHR